MRRVVLALLGVLLLPAAHAQAPSAGIVVDGLTQKYIAASDTQLVPAEVVFTVSNVVCTTNVPLKVTLASSATGPPVDAGENASGRSFSAAASPAEITFTIQQGAYGNNAGLPAARPYQERKTATIAVTARNLTNASTATVDYVARFAGYSGTDCRGSGGLAAVETNGTFRVDFPANAAPLPTPTPELPLPSTLIWLALASALVLTRRRRA